MANLTYALNMLEDILGHNEAKLKAISARADWRPSERAMAAAQVKDRVDSIKAAIAKLKGE